MNDTRRNTLRMKGYDYTCKGQYFITFCTESRRNLLCRPLDGFCENTLDFLTEIGEAVLDFLHHISAKSNDVAIGPYVIMPNHVHMIATVSGKEGSSLHIGKLVKTAKMYSSKAWKRDNNTDTGRLWQRGYYDRVIRNHSEYQRICEYIRNNPHTASPIANRWWCDSPLKEFTKRAGF